MRIFIKTLFFLVSTLGITQLSAQEIKIQGFVMDSLGKPLAFVNVFTELEQGAYSDEIGYFELNSNSKSKFLIFSHLGYKTDTLNLSTINHLDSVKIQLQQMSFVFDEVVVVSEKSHETLGYSKRLGSLMKKENNNLNVNTGNILAYYFENTESKTGKIDYVKFRFNKIKNKPKIRINFYAVKRDSLGNIRPGKILHQSEVLSLKKNDKKFRYNLPIDELYILKDGIFAAIELISGGDYISKASKYELNYPSFMMTEQEPKRLTWKSFMGNKWEKLKITSRKNYNPWNIKTELKVNY